MRVLGRFYSLDGVFNVYKCFFLISIYSKERFDVFCFQSEMSYVTTSASTTLEKFKPTLVNIWLENFLSWLLLI